MKFTKFNEFDFNTFSQLQKWKMKSKRNDKQSNHLTFSFVSPEQSSDPVKALDENKIITIKTPYSVRWTDDNKLNELLPYDIRNAGKADKEKLTPNNIKSTCIDSWEYNPATTELNVYFVGAPEKAYLFPNVPKSIIKRWISAPSKGQFYNRIIKRYSTNI